MQFLRNVELDDLSRKELCLFVSGLSPESMLVYKNTEYEFSEYTESDSVLITRLTFIESKLYSISGAKDSVILINVLAERKVELCSLRFEDDKDTADLPYYETDELREQKAIELAAQEAKHIDDYYYIACVSHDELLDKDNLICVDDAIINMELYSQLKAVVFASTYEAALSKAKEKYDIVRTLRTESNDLLVPALEHYEGEKDETY